MMLVEFENNNDKTRVACDRPWHFDKSLILVQEFDGAQLVKNICMKNASFWLCIHDLSLMAQNEYVGQAVRAALGSVEEVDLDYGEVE